MSFSRHAVLSTLGNILAGGKQGTLHAHTQRHRPSRPYNTELMSDITRPSPHTADPAYLCVAPPQAEEFCQLHAALSTLEELQVEEEGILPWSVANIFFKQATESPLPMNRKTCWTW